MCKAFPGFHSRYWRFRGFQSTQYFDKAIPSWTIFEKLLQRRPIAGTVNPALLRESTDSSEIQTALDAVQLGTDLPTIDLCWVQNWQPASEQYQIFNGVPGPPVPISPVLDNPWQICGTEGAAEQEGGDILLNATATTTITSINQTFDQVTEMMSLQSEHGAGRGSNVTWFRISAEDGLRPFLRSTSSDIGPFLRSTSSDIGPFLRSTSSDEGPFLRSTSSELGPGPFLRSTSSGPLSGTDHDVRGGGNVGPAFARISAGDSSGRNLVADDAKWLWEAFVWGTTEAGDMLQCLLVQVDKAMKKCSSGSVMFTR